MTKLHKYFILLFISTLSPIYSANNLHIDTSKNSTYSIYKKEQQTSLAKSDTYSNIYQKEHSTILSICDSLHVPHEFALIPFAIEKAKKTYSSQANYSPILYYYSSNQITSRCGWWNLAVPIAKIYGLHINSHFDERFSLKASSVAAISHISKLYNIYGNINLATIAFLRSPADLNNQIEMHGIKKMDSIFSIISPEYSIFKELSSNTNITYNTKKQSLSNNKYPTINLKMDIYSQILLSEFNISIKQFQSFNPCINIQGNTLSKKYKIILPFTSNDTSKNTSSNALAIHMDSVYSKSQARIDSIAYAEILRKQEIQEELKRELAVKKYKVKSGDTLGHIAIKYNVSVKALKKWNHLNSDMLQIGQIIKIYP